MSKEKYEPKIVWQSPFSKWFENDKYLICIYKNFIAITPKFNKEKPLYITSQGWVVLEIGTKFYYAKIHTNKTTKQINLLASPPFEEGSETMKVVCPECRECDIFKAFDRNDKLFFQCTSCNAIIKTNLSWKKRRRKRNIMNKIKYVKCELCGKKDKAQNLILAGGCFTYLCPNCRKTANKVIVRFVAHLRNLSFEDILDWIGKVKEEREVKL